MCKVYTGYHGTSEIEHDCAPVRSLIPELISPNRRTNRAISLTYSKNLWA